MAMSLADPGRSAELRAVFGNMDKDSNGQIDTKEWGRIMSNPKVLAVLKRHFGQDATVEEVGRAFKIIDVDSSGTIEFEELISASKAYLAAETASEMCMTPEGVASLKRLFDMIDSNNDG